MKESKPKEARELPETTSIIGMVPVERMKISRIGASEYIKELTDKRDEYFKSCISWLDKYEAQTLQLKESERLREKYEKALTYIGTKKYQATKLRQVAREALAEVKE